MSQETNDDPKATLRELVELQRKANKHMDRSNELLSQIHEKIKAALLLLVIVIVITFLGGVVAM